MQVTYLLNSGFAVETERTVLVFDDYQDPARALERILSESDGKRVYFLASHAHFDHFNGRLIGRYGKLASNYLLSEDIEGDRGVSSLPQNKVVFLPDYSTWQDDWLEVRTFSSTDRGTSFLVTLRQEERTLFHAGDFNWWDWTEEPQDRRESMAYLFQKQLRQMEGLQADLAFFPVDGRLGETRAKGAQAFCQTAEIKALITMHNVGYPAWQPPGDFFARGREVPVWSPVTPGETKEFDVE
jgi:L-ascorbate metabolism protein UlaG (beta-lactamase superfamily)